MENPVLTKSYEAGATVNPFRIIKMGASDGLVIQGAGTSAVLIGVARNQEAVAAGGRVEVCRLGIAQVEYGGSVTRGQVLTSDANGKAVAAVLNPAAMPFVIGIAEQSGSSGDIRPVLVNPGAAMGVALADDADILEATVTISSAELLALNATPKQLIAAPGSGKAIIPVLVQAYKAAGTAYGGIAAGEDVAIRYENGSGAVLATIETTGFLDQTTAQSRAQLPVTTTITPADNKALVAHMTSGEITTGDSDLIVKVQYKVIDTVLS